MTCTTHHHELIDSPLIDTEPLQAHGLEEVLKELYAYFRIGKAVNQRAEILGEFLLHEWLVGHPHAVVEALPQAQKVIVGEVYDENKKKTEFYQLRKSIEG